MRAFKNILVPIDFGEPSKHALEIAVDLAKQYESALTLIHTWELPAYAYGSLEMAPMVLAPIQSAAREMLDKTLADVQKEVPKATAILEQGNPRREILAAIEKIRPDLVIMGTHGRRGVPRLVLGSVAEKIVRTSPAPVLTVRAKDDGDA